MRLSILQSSADEDRTQDEPGVIGKVRVVVCVFAAELIVECDRAGAERCRMYKLRLNEVRHTIMALLHSGLAYH